MGQFKKTSTVREQPQAEQPIAEGGDLLTDINRNLNLK